MKKSVIDGLKVRDNVVKAELIKKLMMLPVHKEKGTIFFTDLEDLIENVSKEIILSEAGYNTKLKEQNDCEHDWEQPFEFQHTMCRICDKEKREELI